MIHQAVNGRLMATKSVTPISNGKSEELGVSKASVYYAVLDICADFTDEEKQKINLEGFKSKYPRVYSTAEPTVTDDNNEVLASINEQSRGSVQHIATTKEVV